VAHQAGEPLVRARGPAAGFSPCGIQNALERDGKEEGIKRKSSVKFFAKGPGTLKHGTS
jgi:hypothetical protein